MWIKAAGLAVGLAAVGTAVFVQYAERSRVIEGTWLYMFEGSSFFEKRLPGQECTLYRDQDDAGWLNYDPTKVYKNYRYDRSFPSSGAYRSQQHGRGRLEAFEVRFKGRKRLVPWGGGHFRGWTSEYDVEQMLLVKPIPGLNCYVR